jgi:glycosyltransferase involved in cell wall biosynthesis
MSQKPVVLFLYTELAEYFLACLEKLEQENIDVHVVRWPVNKEAPFQFRQLEKTTFYERPDLDGDKLLSLYDTLNPDLVLTSGWVDDGYLSVAKKARKEGKSVLLLDNQWVGGLKQRLAGWLSPFIIRNKFNKAWVPGAPQKRFAEKMGFAPNIRTGFYCADCNLFDQFYDQFKEEKQAAFPKRFLFIGRYLEFKGIFDMWKAYQQLTGSSWELWCVGTGDLWEQRVEADGIRHFGFVQPNDLGDIIRETGVFVLPSHKEPWGVVVHEMAAAGFPMICSDTIGAASTFLEEGENGYFHKAGDSESIYSAMKRVSELSESELQAMSDHSRKLSKTITPALWVKTLMELL